MHKVIFYLITVLICTSITCTISDLAGNSSDTQNGITIVSSGNSITGSANSNTKISVFSHQYTPITEKFDDFADSTMADSMGQFSFSMPQGSYKVLCRDIRSGRTFLSRIVSVGSASIDSLSDSMKATGAILGKEIKLQDGHGSATYFYISGSPYYAKLDSSGSFLITEVPAGSHSIYKTILDLNGIKINQGATEGVREIEVIPGETVIFSSF